MKESIISTGGKYSTSRMLVDYTNNLYKLLNDYGLVLISCFSSTNTSFLRNSLFRDKFEFIKMARTFDSDLYGYVYRKRR